MFSLKSVTKSYEEGDGLFRVLNGGHLRGIYKFNNGREETIFRRAQGESGNVDECALRFVQREDLKLIQRVVIGSVLSVAVSVIKCAGRFNQEIH